MADPPTSSFPTAATAPAMAGNWQTVEQAAVALGLSVRTVNRHITAQKLKSRLMDGRREVFVPSADQPPLNTPTDVPNGSVPTPQAADNDTTTSASSVSIEPDSFLDLDTALAMADRKADRQVELAVRAYQTLTQTIEGQAQEARRTARIAWCIVGVLAVGATSALLWTATRVTQAENLKKQADESEKRAADSEKRLADMQEKLSEAQQYASRAEGRVSVFEEIQSHQAASQPHQPASQPNTRPTTQSLIDPVTNAFSPSGQ